MFDFYLVYRSDRDLKSWHHGRSNFSRVPVCHALPRVPKRAWHSGKAIFPERNTRGRRAHEKEKLHLTATLDEAVYKKIEKPLPRVPSPSTRGRWPLPREPAPNTRGRDLFPECLVPGTRGNILFFYFFCPNFFVRPSNII
jgi:hypothetical protein